MGDPLRIHLYVLVPFFSALHLTDLATALRSPIRQPSNLLPPTLLQPRQDLDLHRRDRERPEPVAPGVQGVPDGRGAREAQEGVGGV